MYAFSFVKRNLLLYDVFYLKILCHDEWAHLGPHLVEFCPVSVCVCVHFHLFIFRPEAVMSLGGFSMSFRVMVPCHIWKIGHRRRDRTNLLHMVGFKSSPGGCKPFFTLWINLGCVLWRVVRGSHLWKIRFVARCCKWDFGLRGRPRTSTVPRLNQLDQNGNTSAIFPI